MRAGRYPYQPLRGYKRELVKGVPEKDGLKADILQKVLKDLAAGRVNLTESLKEYNELGPTAYHDYKQVKMDKWKKLIINPFYAGIVEMNRQVKFRNEHGLHEPLITKVEHEKIIEIVEGRNKNKVHNGPRKNGNPEFPLGKLVRHVNCSKKHTKYNIFVDLNQSNGKKKNDRIYKKYRCRGCYFSLPKEDMERQIGEICGKIEMTERGRNAFSCALDDV